MRRSILPTSIRRSSQTNSIPLSRATEAGNLDSPICGTDLRIMLNLWRRESARFAACLKTLAQYSFTATPMRIFCCAQSLTMCSAPISFARKSYGHTGAGQTRQRDYCRHIRPSFSIRSRIATNSIASTAPTRKRQTSIKYSSFALGMSMAYPYMPPTWMATLSMAEIRRVSRSATYGRFRFSIQKPKNARATPPRNQCCCLSALSKSALTPAIWCLTHSVAAERLWLRQNSSADRRLESMSRRRQSLSHNAGLQYRSRPSRRC